LKTAFHFGADAVYLGLKKFSLRNFATNFEWDELEWALEHARTLGRRVYVALNMLPYDEDLTDMDPALRRLAKLGPHGVILSDPGVVELCRRAAPALPIHLSTQANVMNRGAVEFWARQGIRRIVMARELSVDQLSKVARGSPAELEVFVHGAVCISYSGRCFLSLYWADRDAQRGECTQACRWRYQAVEEHRRPGQKHYLMEDDRYSYFFDARDLCAMPLLDDLVDAGIAALKIEGRMRSAHYVAVATDVYRCAADWLANDERVRWQREKGQLVAELARVSNRGFSTHFLSGEPLSRQTYNVTGSRYDNFDVFIGRVVARDEAGVVVALKNPLRPGDRVEFRDRGLVREPVTVPDLRLEEGREVDFGRAGDRVRIPGHFAAGVNAIVRRTGQPDSAVGGQTEGCP